MLTVLAAGLVLRSPPPLRNTAPCTHAGQPAACRVRMRANVAEPVAMQSLADMIGDRNAKRLMRTTGMPSLLAAIPRLSEEFGISGDGLVTLMSGSVAARLEDEAFWAGLARLGELGIAGDGLVSFMSNSVAARLDNHGFMDGLSSLCSELSPPVVIGLLKNNGGVASRLTAEYARSVLSITRHLDSHGLDGAKCLKTLIGKTPLVGKVPELEALLLSLDSPGRIEGELQRFRGPYAHKRAMAATL